MKVIALIPFKNEGWILPTYLSNVLPVVDEIIGIDDGSTDNSRQIMEDAGVKIHETSRIHDIEYGASITPRQKLLELGRESGGTHFVMLDADETFTTNFVPVARDIMNQMTKGSALWMHWLALWESWDHFRHDETIWSNNFKDFIFCDDGISQHTWDGKCLHSIARTPVQGNNQLRTPTNVGSVLHYQFSNMNLFHTKQSWYRMTEHCKYGSGHENIINRKYSITLLNKNIGRVKCPDSWTEDIPLPLNKNNFDPEWSRTNTIRVDLLDEMLKMMDEHGVEYFEGLDIWHVPPLKNKFIAESGRVPNAGESK